MTIASYFSALAATVAIECAIAYFFGIRRERGLGVIVGVNIITHPILHIYLLVISLFSTYVIPFFFFGEILVIASEWLLLSLFLNEKKWNIFALSCGMNLASLGGGYLLLKPFF